jgi:hypothetical protein
MGFPSLQHIRMRRSTCHGLCLPATFRPQGLVTLSTACSLRIPAGFVSHRRRSWDSPSESSPLERYPRVSTRMDPPTVSPSLFSRRGPTGRQTRPRFLGFHPSESPWPDLALLARDRLAAPLGFPFQGIPTKTLPRISPQLLSCTWPRTRQDTGLCFRVSIGLRFASRFRVRTRSRKATLVGF